jgi:hypothetical protein
MAFNYQPVSSSNISEAGYDLDNQVMAIRFRKGSEYRATGVPAAAFTEFMQAGSKGSYFHRVLKGAYNWTKV